MLSSHVTTYCVPTEFSRGSDLDGSVVIVMVTAEPLLVTTCITERRFSVKINIVNKLYLKQTPWIHA